MRKLFTLLMLPALVFMAVSCTTDAEDDPQPANEITDSEGVNIILEWSTGGSSTQAMDDADLDLALYHDNTEIDESSAVRSFEEVTIEPIYTDGEYLISVSYYGGNTGVNFNVYVQGIDSGRTLEYTGSFTSDDAGEASFPDFIKITKTGNVYSIVE